MKTTIRILCACLALSAGAIARAEPAPICEATEELDKHALLRQLSLDLRGRVPSYEEYEYLDNQDNVGEAEIMAMLGSDDFRAQIRKYHRELLWPSLDRSKQTTLFNNMRTVDKYIGGDIYWSFGATVMYRGSFGMRCANKLQTEFDEDGRPVPFREGDDFTAQQCPSGNCRQEGYVLVNPWWAPETEIKICAYEAQEHTQGFKGACDKYDPTDRGCGCGPNLERCRDFQHSDEIAEHLEEEPLRIFENVIMGGRPYSEALTSNETYLSSKLAHFYRHNSHSKRFMVQDPGMRNPLPDKVWSDEDDWQRYDRDSAHSGVLTSLAFLVRFGSHRSRVNKFYDTFLCQPFAAVGVPENDGECSKNPDLSSRCGCAACHSTIEPAAVHWGRWDTQTTYGHLREDDLPVFNPGCATCEKGNCKAVCYKYYVSEASTDDQALLDEWAGFLLVAAFRDDDEMKALKAGPAALLAQGSNMENFNRCTVRTLAERLWNRPLTETEAREWLPEMADQFADNEQDYLVLFRDLLNDWRYRTIE